ncbi:hypothetical protein HPB47_011022 [Ixodes persulcatus]|uniref:Uncharacterized protein n=1 Tax=Ixodes persulcatus TaxID=34615 RepID=A0AC60NXP4_IXOPE|nr:hypothetical protein HPB47_011022 [Ixodes persulcatus]
MSPKSRHQYSASFKRKVILYSEEKNNVAAERSFGVSEKCVRGWRQQRDKIFACSGTPRTVPSCRGSGEGWVREQRDKSFSVSYEDIEGKARATPTGRVKRASLSTVAQWVNDAWYELPTDMVREAFLKCIDSQDADSSDFVVVSATRPIRPPCHGPAVTAVSRVATTVVVSPFVIIVSRSFVHTMDTTCADLCHSCADVVECRRHQYMVKGAVQTTLSPGTRGRQCCPSLRRGSRDILYHMIAMFLAARAGLIRHTVNKLSFSEQCYYVFGDLCSELCALRLGAESEADRDTLGPLPAPGGTSSCGLGPPWGPFSAGASGYLGPGAFLPLGYPPPSSSVANHSEAALASYVNYAREGSAHSGSGGSGGGGTTTKDHGGGNNSDSEGASQRSGLCGAAAGGDNSSNSDHSTRTSRSREPQAPQAVSQPPPGGGLESMPHDLTGSRQSFRMAMGNPCEFFVDVM